MTFHQVEQDTSFYGLTQRLIGQMNNKVEGEYLLFNREEAKKVHLILDSIWHGVAHVSVSFFYKGDDVIAFKAYKPELAYDNQLSPVRLLDAQRDRLDTLFGEPVTLTEEDKDFIRDLFNLKKAA